MLTAEELVRIAHEANRAYCTTLGDHTIPSWDAAPEWQRESAIAGVTSALSDPGKTPEQSHAEWSEHKLKAGWKFGPIKRPEVLEHPCLVSWSELPAEQKVKDRLFLAIVNAAGHDIALPDIPEAVYQESVIKEPVIEESVPEVKPSKRNKRFGG